MNTHKHIILNDIEYPVMVSGSGPHSGLCIGLGNQLAATLSEDFKRLFTLYSSNLYWTHQHTLESVQQISITSLIEDLRNMIKQLELENVMLIGHSAFGLLGLELAKLNDPQISGLIMIGTPTNSNSMIAHQAEIYFQTHACAERKINDALRKKQYKKIKKPHEPFTSLNAYESLSARYWADYTITRDVLEKIWQHGELDSTMSTHLFHSLFPNFDTTEHISSVTIPVLLVGGQLDFNCIPLELWKVLDLPCNFTIADCGNTGHWPHLENSKLFDTIVATWIHNYKETRL